MRTSFRTLWLGMVFLLSLKLALGQVSQSSASISTAQPATTASSVAASLKASRQSLARTMQSLRLQEKALIAQGATGEQLAAWEQRNAARFAALRQLAQSIEATSYLQTRATNFQPHIPPGASQAMQDYLTTRAALMKAMAQTHNQLVHQATASGKSLTVAQVEALKQQEAQTFLQQNKELLVLQAQRVNAVANESAQRIATTSQQSTSPMNFRSPSQFQGTVSTGTGPSN